jgi:hypothetical protein
MTTRGAFRNLFVLGRSWSSMVDFVSKIDLQRLIGLDWPGAQPGTGASLGRKAYRGR